MMEAAGFSETSMDFYQTIRRNNPEENQLQCLDVFRASKVSEVHDFVTGSITISFQGKLCCLKLQDDTRTLK
jgi:hypothetical protein